MADRQKTGAPTGREPLRLWPGVVAVVLQWLATFAVPVVMPGPAADLIWPAGAFGGGLAIGVWWVFFSRAPRSERWGAGALTLAAAPLVNHESMGLLTLWLAVYAVPVLSLAFVGWAVASRHLPDGLRRAAMVATILVTCGAWTLVRSEGATGNNGVEFTWRWVDTAEERLMALGGDEPVALPPASAHTTRADGKTGVEWPGFRGPTRDSIIPGVRLDPNWSRSPPVELWRRPIGPGWSSFAVRGGVLYTQEQRGDDELVISYRLTTGEPVWRHRDTVRFWDANGGAGPRATPTLGNGRLYTFGATGILNALDPDDGDVL